MQTIFSSDFGREVSNYPLRSRYVLNEKTTMMVLNSNDNLDSSSKQQIELDVDPSELLKQVEDGADHCQEERLVRKFNKSMDLARHYSPRHSRSISPMKNRKEAELLGESYATMGDSFATFGESFANMGEQSFEGFGGDDSFQYSDSAHDSDIILQYSAKKQPDLDTVLDLEEEEEDNEHAASRSKNGENKDDWAFQPDAFSIMRAPNDSYHW